MNKSRPIRIRSTHVTYDKNYSEEEAEKNVYRLKELIALAMLEYVKKNKEQFE